MSGFITDYLPDFPGDWECIEDICSQSGGLTSLNACAWYSPSRNQTLFGGDWFMCPPLPYRASEQQVWAHAREHSPWGKRLQAERRRNNLREEKSKLFEQRLKANGGVNLAIVILELRDGSEYQIVEPVGLRTILEVLPCATELLKPRGKYEGAILKRLAVRPSPNQAILESFMSGKEDIRCRPDVVRLVEEVRGNTAHRRRRLKKAQ